MSKSIPWIYLVFLLPTLTGAAMALDTPHQREAHPIVGGSIIPAHEAPWLVRVVTSTGGKRYACTGSLIARNWVLTAAHCVEGEPVVDHVSIQRGPDLRKRELREGAEIGRVVFHPDFKALFPYDVALVELLRPYDQEPIPLLPVLPETGSDITVMGFGKIEDDTWPQQARVATSDVLAWGFCTDHVSMGVQDSCAGRTGTEVRGGDSGSIWAVPLESGGWGQIGVTRGRIRVSGNLSNLNLQITVFTRIEAIHDWILETVGPPDTMTTFVPVVLSAGGKNNSFFTSELTLTNRGSEAAMLNYTYTAHQPKEGGGSGTATDMLGPHQQMIASNAITYLRDLEVPIPETGNRVGTLRVDVAGSSDVSAVVRTTTAVPEGRAGLAYLGIPENKGFHDEAVYLCGLRDTQGDRSNVAVQNMGSEGSITLRITAFSGNPTDSSGEMVWEDTLHPGEFHQVNAVLMGAGKVDPMFGGYVKVERVEGMAPFYAYGVINDNANSDGSFVFPVSASSLEGAMGQTLPALVESGAFTTELTLTNFSDQQKLVMFSATHERIETADNTAGFGPLPMLPGQQLIIPHALAYARQNLGLNVPMGLVVPLIANPVGGDLSGIVIGARVVAQADPARHEQGAVRRLLHGGAPGQGIHRHRLGGRVAAE